MSDALAALAPPGAATAGQAGAGGQAQSAGGAAARPVSNIVGIFAWHPALSKGFFTFNSHLFHSTLSDRLREMVTIRTGWVRRAEYEWSQHVRMGRAVGMSDAEIEGISEGPDSPTWGSFEAAVLRAVDELCADRYISDTTWAQLSAELDRQQIMDLVFTVGAYDLLGMAMNTFGLELDPGLESFPAERPA
jgi:alkylhydroperoxidase family enzyme